MSPVVEVTRTVVACSLSEQFAGCPCVSLSFCDSLLRNLFDSLGQLLVSLFSQFLVSFVMVMYIMTVVLTAELW